MSNRYFMSWLYLVLALLGALLTADSNIKFVMEYGANFDIAKFLDLAVSNPAAESLTRDLLVGASAVTIWIVNESKRLNMKYLWFILLTSALIAFAFAAPMFLCLRERRLIEIEEKNV